MKIININDHDIINISGFADEEEVVVTDGVANNLYFSKGKYHRLDGPAVEQGDIKEWWYHGLKINCSSQKQFERYLNLRAFW